MDNHWYHRVRYQSASTTLYACRTNGAPQYLLRHYERQVCLALDDWAALTEGVGSAEPEMQG